MPERSMPEQPETSDARPRQSEAKQAGVLVWGKIAAKFSAGLAPLLLVRMLDEEQVGAFAALMLIYETVLILLTAGMPRAALYFLADRSLADRRATVVRMSWFMLCLGAGAGVLLALVGWLGADVLRVVGGWLVELFGGESKQAPVLGPELAYLPLLGLHALVDVPTRLLPNVLLVEGRARASAGVGVIRSLGMVAAMLIPALLGWGVLGIMAGTVAFGFAFAGYSLVWLAELYRAVPADQRELAGRDLPGLRELNRYALSLGSTDIVSWLNGRLDLWLILIFFTATDVAHYGSGAWQIPMITTIAFSVSEVYLPRFTKLFQDRKGFEAIAIWRESIAKVSLIVVPIAMIFVVAAEEFIELAFTADYLPAAPVFRCYCLLTMARVTAFGNVMLAAGKPEYVLRSAAFTLLSNLIISVPLVFALGFIGPALGTLIAFVPTVFYYCWFIGKAAGVPVRETFPGWAYFRVVLACLPVAGLALTFKLLVAWHPALMFLVEALIVVVGYSVFATWVGLITREDWRFVSAWARLRQMD
ncbi:oligosaccharide flippase family protein [Nannocystaceae bacterium ST9]